MGEMQQGQHLQVLTRGCRDGRDGSSYSYKEPEFQPQLPCQSASGDPMLFSGPHGHLHGCAHTYIYTHKYTHTQLKINPTTELYLQPIIYIILQNNFLI